MTAMAADRVFPAPPVGPDNAAFVEAARQGRFTIRRCTACGQAHWYPRPLCPFCFGETEWVEASGRGTVYSYSVMRRATPVTSIAYVTLAEGPVMMTALVDCDLDALRIGMDVRLVWKPSATEGVPVPCFTPAEGG